VPSFNTNLWAALPEIKATDLLNDWLTDYCIIMNIRVVQKIMIKIFFLSP